MVALRLTRIGDDVVVMLSEQHLEELRLQVGDVVDLRPLVRRASEEDIERQRRLSHEIMNEYAETFSILAKS